MASAFSIDLLEPTSKFQTPVTFLLYARKILVIQLSGFAGMFTLSTLAHMFQFWPTLHTMQRHY